MIGILFALFFGLRALARMGLPIVGPFNKFPWLNVAIGVFVSLLWSAGVGLIIGESAAEFYIPNFAERTLAGALPIGSALVLFFGLRALARIMLLRRQSA